MKKIIVVVIAISLVLIIAKASSYLKIQKYKSNNDIIIVSKGCQSESFMSCKKYKHVYNIQNGEVKVDSIPNVFKESSNIYVVLGEDINTVAYFDKRTAKKIRKANFKGDEIARQNIIEKYKYKESEYEFFKKIMIAFDSVEEYKFNQYKYLYIENFIVTKNNYYIYLYDTGNIYKYDQANDILAKFLKIEGDEIIYFYEK